MSGSVLEIRLVRLALFAGVVVANRADTEEADHVLKSFSLRRELFRCARKLFGACGVALGNQTNLADGSIDLIYAGSLFSGGSRDFLNQVRGFLNCRNEFGQ